MFYFDPAAMQIDHAVDFVDDQVRFIVGRHRGRVRVFLIGSDARVFTCCGQLQIWEELTVSQREELFSLVEQDKYRYRVFEVTGAGIVQDWLARYFYGPEGVRYGSFVL